jgi:hypothetical protein
MSRIVGMSLAFHSIPLVVLPIRYNFTTRPVLNVLEQLAFLSTTPGTLLGPRRKRQEKYN